MKPDEGGGQQVFTVSRDYKADNADALTVHLGEKLVLIKAEGGDPSKWLMQSIDNPKRKGWVPIVILTPKDDIPDSVQQVIFKREAVISELVETEEEYCKDIMQVVDYYMKPLDGAGTPKHVCDNKDRVFGNYKDIAVFHNTVLLEGIKYYAKEPKQLGRAFLRMERDFDKHVTYCHDEPAAQDFLEQNEKIRDFFDDLGSRISDDKNIGEHLKLPVQRINDYQLLLKELVKYSERLEEDTTDLNKALELMLGIPHKADDLKYITNIEGYHGDIHKLGRLLRHNWFKVKGKDGKEHERYLFLFKARILICKVRKIAGDTRYVFGLKDIIRLPDVQVKDHKADLKTFEVGQFTVTTHQEHVKEPWLEEIRQYSRNALTLAEHQADDLRLEEAAKENYPLKGVELVLATPGNSSDEEMDKSSRRTSLSQRVQELKTSSVTESSYSMSSSKTVVMEVSSQSTTIQESSTHIETSIPTMIQQQVSSVEIEDMTSRCNLQSLFSKTIEGCTAEPGGGAAFECDIESESITWIKDNKPLSDRLHDRITQMSVGSHHRLEILNVAESDAGVYTAIANTKNGKVSTCTANLVVEKRKAAKKITEEAKKAREEAKAPVFVVMLKDTELMQNTFLRFMVKLKGEPNPSVKFYKDDVEITYKNERIAVNNDKESVGYYEMVIPNVQTVDAGLYKCVATNSAGSATSEGRVTVVDEKKVFEGMEPPKTPTSKRDDASFQWIKDGKPFDPEERFKVLLQDDEDSLALVFTHVKPEDAGLYTCVASTTSGKISCSAELTVQGNVNLLAREPEAPAIKAAHKSVESNVGSSAMLETKIKGYPKPEIKWFKEDKELVMGDRYKILYEDDETISLVVKTVTSSDDGVYRVVATNAAGSSEDTVTLNIKAPPTFKKKLNDIKATAGAELKLQVEVQANPKPDVQWFKDGKVITESEHFKMVEENETYSLLIENCNLFDVGSYSVICKNNISQCSEFCKVEIEGAPVFTRNLIKKVETEEGDSLTFLVKVHGNPMPIVKWYFKGQPVITDNRCKISHDMDTHTLTINSINRQDAGEYTCELQNAHGSVKDSGVVMVKCSPVFSKGLGNLVAQEGDSNVGFNVNVSSYPRGKIRWFINSKEISSTSTEYLFKEDETSYTMVIKEVTRDSAGTYSCKVENIYGSTETSSDLTVLCKPQFKQELKNVTVNAGETLTLEIEIAGTPAPDLKWFKDGTEITNDMHIKIKRDSQRIENYSLTVDLVKAEDSGEYEVRASNEMGSAISKSTVTVQTIPKITESQMKNSEVFETWEATFQVTATGVPHPEAIWTQNGKVLEASEKRKMTDDGKTYTMVVNDCQVEDEGEYKVTLKNLLGEDSDKAELRIIPAKSFRLPQILTPLVDQKIPKTETVNMIVVLTADPIPEIEWKRDGKDLSTDKDVILNAESKLIHHGLKECTYTLIIPVSKHFDTGDYTFTATNKSGTATTSARLDIILKPEFEMFKDLTIVPFEDATMLAVVRSNPRATLTWRKDGNKISEDSHYAIINDAVNEIYKLVISNIHPEDEALYTLSAVNEIGDASADARLMVHTERPSFTKGLEDIAVRDYAQLELKIRAEGIPKPDISWSKDGEDVVETEGMQLYTRCEGTVSSTLTIPHFSVDYCGKYKARAQSLSGYADSQCNVRMVQLKPTFSKALERALNVEESDPVDLHCKIEASPRANCRWLKDGEELQPSANVQYSFKPDGTVRLRIESSTPEDCGAYKLIAENPIGVETAICALSVTPSSKKPLIIKKLEDVEITEGEPMMLEAQIVGFPLPEIKWYKDGLPLRVSKSFNFVNSPGGVIGLSVEQAGVEHGGEFTLTVSNKLGEASASAKVTVNLKDRRPEFHGHLVPTTVIEGFPAKLSVKIAGTPLPQLSWSLNGTPIEIDGEHFRIVESPNGIFSLMIENSGPLDAGTYAVTATNPAGSVTSTAKLEVAGQARKDMPEEEPAFAYEMRDAHADEGSPLHFSVPFRGNPVPQVTWTKNGLPVKPDHRITLTNDGHKLSLQINPCEMTDVGEYICKLSNQLGRVETMAAANVRKIFHAPVFTQKLTDLDQVIGLDGKMICRVSGNPRPKIHWYRNGKQLHDGPKYAIKRDGDSCMLYIKESTPDDEGTFTCVAENRDGQDSCEAKFKAVDKISSVDKGEKPCFLKKIGDQEVVNGITGRFTACISGNPTPEVEWYRNGDRLYPSDRIKMDHESNGLLRLTVTHIDPAIDIGRYKLRITNDHGEDVCEASFIYDIMGLGQRRPVGEQYKDFEEFKLTGSPLPLPDKPIISRMSDRRLTLSWRPSIPIGPREPVSYLVEMCEMPSGSWFIARSGLRSCTCEIRNLEPFRDYKFRVRVENKFGVSEPSPFAQTFRAKLLPDQPKFIPYLAPDIDFRPDTSPYFPKDFDIERPPHDGYAQAPRFLRQEHFTQYGVKGHNCNLFWFVYGYPKPKMNYYFNGEPIEMGGRYNWSYTRNGQATLFINRMLDRDVGVYEAVAFNEHGESRQRVHLEIAEYPEFIRRPEEITILARQGGRIEARLIGVPYPEVKWFKDWQPLAHSARIKIQRYDPDHCVLAITDAITKDSGLYSITASNVAGAVSCSVMVHVEEKEEFPFHMYGLGHNIKLKTKHLSDFYDLGDELGRGTQGITYHAVERTTGRNFAAKVMKGKGDYKTLMHNELDIMNILRHYKLIKIHDGFETLDTIILVLELASGGELLDCLTKTPYTNENEIASYIRQLLVGLDYLHEQNIAHVGLTPGDILISHSGGDSVKICDYGLARRIHPGQLRPEQYGMPEYVSPEIVKGHGVSLATDMWSVGVITHLLLTGISLFKGTNDMETLTKVREGYWEFNEEYWRGLSLDARDFITKLLIINPEERMSVKDALRHPWLKIADYAPADASSISTENLHNYYNSWKDWYSNASCRTWYRRRPLAGAFTHPSKMVYPPNYIATPTESPERDVKRDSRPKQNLGDAIFSRQPMGYDIGAVSSESHYQSGPDTYLLQLRDVDFPVRLREYMKVAAHRHTIPKVTDEPSHLDWQLPVIRERRRFTDVMDEEIDDERKSRISQYNLGDTYTVRRLKHELGTRLDTHVEAEALIEATRQGQSPFMREKPQTTAILEGKVAELVCFAVGDPSPVIQWFKNDMMIGNSNRVKILDDEKGRSILKLDPAINSDTGIYKVVARNRIGQTVARARVVLAGVPDAPDSPEVTDTSDTQALLRWKQPKHDGNDPVICYMLQSKVVEGGDWKTVSDKIEHEFYLVQRLNPATGYIFRLAAKNKIGWSDTGVASANIRTKEEGCAKVQVSKTMKALQYLSESGQGFIDDSKLPLDYSLEENPIQRLNHSPTEKYSFISEIYRGRFSVVVKAIDKSSDQVMVCKLFENSPVEEAKVTAEFEVLRSLKHERIANLIEAYLPPDGNYCAFVLEKLQGADILSYLSNRHEYNEQMVATIISQVLDALQYLHWRGLSHLDLQPDNIVMASVRSVQVKLVDFGCAQKVTKLGNSVKTHGALEFSAPEVICQEPAYPQSDIWSIGVLAYLLLSGVSPFHGENVSETRQNINFVRYRFEHLYKEITQEATRFLMQIFKRTPNKRPSAEECHEHRWLCPNEYMIKKRERAVFLGNRLKAYSDLYHQQRDQEASSLEALTCLVASQGPLVRSNSIAEELTTTS